MSLLKRAGALASDAARLQAEQLARRAARRAAAFVAVAVLLSLALVFGAVAGYTALQSETGPVAAALIVSGASLFLALAVAALSRSRPTARERAREDLDKLARDARAGVEDLSPYMVAAAFVSGFLSGRKR